MDSVIEKRLKDGSRLQLLRLVFPGAAVYPEWVRNLFGAPEASGWGRDSGLNLCGWEKYYCDMFTGASGEECTDYLYALAVDGKPASRMWFGFSNRSGIGNFGNVVTFPEFRKRGLMSLALEACTADFAASKALLLACSAAPAAAQAYEAAGFQRIIDPESSPMALMKPGTGTFAEVLERAYGNSENASVRSGKRGDRFEIDKLLGYVPAIYRGKKPANLFCNWIPDYLHAFQRVRPGSSAISVIESASGFCAGYAYAERCLPEVTPLMFTVHPDFLRYLPRLFDHVLRGLPGDVLACPNQWTAECETVLRDNGFTPVGSHGLLEKKNRGEQVG